LIPEKGETITYGEIARRLDTSARAVARALASNPYPVKIACHRVIMSSGKLGGYSGPGGIEGKKKLLKEEGVEV